MSQGLVTYGVPRQKREKDDSVADIIVLLILIVDKFLLFGAATGVMRVIGTIGGWNIQLMQETGSIPMICPWPLTEAIRFCAP